MFSLANCPSGACHDVDKLHGDIFHREDGPGVVVRVHSWAVVWLPADGCRRMVAGEIRTTNLGWLKA